MQGYWRIPVSNSTVLMLAFLFLIKWMMSLEFPTQLKSMFECARFDPREAVLLWFVKYVDNTLIVCFFYFSTS